MTDTGAARAGERLEAAGKLDQALRAYLDAGQYTAAARVAERLGRTAEAASLYDRAGQPLAAAACHTEAGEPALALASLLHVDHQHADYRRACVLAIGLAAETDKLSAGLEHTLSRFVGGGPRDSAERAAFLRLAQLYARHRFTGNALETLRTLLASVPDHPEALALLRKIEQQAEPAADHLPGLPQLPQLPPLPPRPNTGRSTAPSTAPTERTEKEPGRLLVAGSVIASRYRLDEKIGQGGMSVVFRATDLALSEPVAVKVFTQVEHDTESEGRFRLELKLSRQLVHANIIRLYDIGLYYDFRYISMELLEGRDLQARLASPFSLQEGLNFLIQACAGLQAAHDQGVIHRDIKPGNVFITRQGVIKLMDFGIAKMQAAPGVTATGIIAGTPAYMSPEQIQNFSGVTHLADLYALGVVAYEMFTGSLPFQDADPMSVLLMHLHDPPPPLRSRNPRVPEALEAVILRLLAKRPEDRPASSAELARELEAIRDSHS